MDKQAPYYSREMSFLQSDDCGRAAVGLSDSAGERSTVDAAMLNGGKEDEEAAKIGHRADSTRYLPPAPHRYGRHDTWGQSTGASFGGLDRSGHDEYEGSCPCNSSPRDPYRDGSREDKIDYYGGASTTCAHCPSVKPHRPSLNSGIENAQDEKVWNRESLEPHVTSRYAVSPGEDRCSYSNEPGAVAKRPSKQLPFEKKENHSPTSMKTIEVSPGEHLRLRGADETWRAVQLDYYSPYECMCCSLTVFCILDAAFVLCPACRVVSPTVGSLAHGSDGGVGLGFTIEDLAKWQEEINESSRAT